MDFHSISYKSGIYGIRHIITGKLYIGSAVSLRKRLRNHVSDLTKKKHHSPRLQNAWNKYGSKEFEIIVFLEDVDKKDLIQLEQTYLDTHKCYLPENGYNICKTAGSRSGQRHSESTKLKLSEASKVQWQDPAYMEYMRALTKAQMKDKCKPFICIQNEKLYQSTRDAAAELNLDSSSITKVLRGKINQIKGFSFRYEDSSQDVKCSRRAARSKIICHENNVIYPTITDAGIALNISLGMISQAVNKRKRDSAKGYTFSTVE